MGNYCLYQVKTPCGLICFDIKHFSFLNYTFEMLVVRRGVSPLNCTEKKYKLLADS